MAINWVQTAMPVADHWERVEYISDGIFIAVASQRLARSTDYGQTWELVANPPYGRVPSTHGGIVYGNGIVVMALSNHSAVSRDKGVTWSTYANSIPISCFRICYDDINKVFIAVGSSGDKCAVSTDGISWTAYNLPNSGSYSSLAAANGTCIIPVRNTNNAWVSRDGGKTWEIKWTGSISDWSDIAYFNNKFIVCCKDGNSGSITYCDGQAISFGTSNFMANGTWYGIAGGVGRWVSVDNGSRIFVESTDGGNKWTYSAFPYIQSSSYLDIAYGGGAFVVVPSASNINAFYAILNSAPSSPNGITVPAAVQGGQTLAVSWGAATDLDKNLAGYILERQNNGGAWTQVYKGTLQNFTDTITFGWTSVAYRVKAYDQAGAESGYTTSPTRTVTNNRAPAISGSDGDKGTFSASFTAQAYTVTDADNDAVTVIEQLDGVQKRSYTASLGTSNSFSFTAAEWQQILNGKHTITIIATDAQGARAVRTWTFTKAQNSLTVSLGTVLPADSQPLRCIVNVQGAFPSGSTLKVEVCNNGNDAAPTWEDITSKVLSRQKHFFANESKTAAKWGVNVRVTLTRGSATGPCYVESVGGNFA